jgi:hypothetical protein
MIDKNEIRREFLRQAIPPTPTPDIVQRCKECASACDRCQYTHEEAATTIKALREAVAARDEAIRVLGELYYNGVLLGYDRQWRDAQIAKIANPIARDACEGSTTETRTLPPLGP